MDVTVKNEGREYTFGFYLWKPSVAASRASTGSGSLNDLLSEGQKSLFERLESRRMSVIKGADVKVKTKGDAVVITLRDKDDLKHLFSTKPTEVIFKTKFPGAEETKQTVSVLYQ